MILFYESKTAAAAAAAGGGRGSRSRTTTTALLRFRWCGLCSFVSVLILLWIAAAFTTTPIEATPSPLSSSSIKASSQTTKSNAISSANSNAISNSDSSSPPPFRNWLLVGEEEQKQNHRFFAIRHGQSEANVGGFIASDPATAVPRFGLSQEGQSQARRAGARLVEEFRAARAESRSEMHKQHEHDGRLATAAAPSAPSSTSVAVVPRDPPEGIVVVTSDFARALQTAEALVRAVQEHNDGLSEDEFEDERIPLYALDGANTKDNTNGNLTEVGNGCSGTSTTNSTMGPCGLLTIDPRLRERYFGKWDGRSDVHYRDVWTEDAIDPSHTLEGVESVWSVVDRATSLVRDYRDKHCNNHHHRQDNNNDNNNMRCLWVVCVAHGDVLQILQTAFCGMDPAKHRSLPHLDTATLRELD